MPETNTVFHTFLQAWKGREEDIVLVDRGREYTFAMLMAWIQAFEAPLQRAGNVVGIVMEHGIWQIAAILAVLKAGKAYVPAEPFFPPARISFMLQDAGASACIVQKESDDPAIALPKIQADILKPVFMEDGTDHAKGDDLAYVLYTSGSTGLPKGVAIAQKNIVNYARAFAAEFVPEREDAMLQYSVCSFDIFVEEVLAALLNGVRLVIPEWSLRKDLPKLMDYVQTQKVTMISGFPYLLLELNALPSLPRSLRLLISGGDVLRASYIDHLKDQVMIYNTYGPSETTVCASYCRCDNIEPLYDGTYPIGHPVHGVSIQVLDPQKQPCAPGKTGEICIAGKGVGAGYIGHRPIENQAFEKQADGSVLYHSGDLGYVLEDGNLAFVSRMDTQVMIDGRRVEVAEVENILCQCKGISSACVLDCRDGRHLSYLCAFVVCSPAFAGLLDLKEQMLEFLPDYMIPEFFVAVDHLPLTINGKVDRHALPVVMK